LHGPFERLFNHKPRKAIATTSHGPPTLRIQVGYHTLRRLRVRVRVKVRVKVRVRLTPLMIEIGHDELESVILLSKQIGDRYNCLFEYDI